MKRTVITMDGNGEFSIPSNLQDLWMIEGELVDMLHVTAPKLHAVIRSMYKEGLFLVSDVQQKKETSKGIWQTQYGFPMIVALCFRINSYGFSLPYNIFSTTQLKNTHHLVCRRMYLWIYWQPLYSPKWLQQRSLRLCASSHLGKPPQCFSMALDLCRLYRGHTAHITHSA